MGISIRVRITPEYPKLVVSADGRIQGPSGKWLKQRQDSQGYPVVGIYRPGGRSLPARVHIIVCTAFHGARPSLHHEVAHWDGDRWNNAASNLRWTTCADNNADKIRHGTLLRGEQVPNSRLTRDQVRELRSGLLSSRAYAEKFGVHSHTVDDARARRTWRWLT